MGIFDIFQKKPREILNLERDLSCAPSSPAKEFLEKYETEEQELTVLLRAVAKGGLVDRGYLVPSVRFLAYIDRESGKAVPCDGMLSWVIPRSSKNYIHNFKDYGIYKVLVRQMKEGSLYIHRLPMDWQNCYYIVKILAKNLKEPQLEAIREAHLKPVSIQNELGSFALKRECNWFEGQLDWLGSTEDLILDKDKDSDTANTALKTLRMLMSDAPKWDKTLRDYAAEQLTESANDWQEGEEDEPITKEAFAQRIGTPYFHIHSDGSFEADFDDDDMFYGHGIVVYCNADGTLEDADIEG